MHLKYNICMRKTEIPYLFHLYTYVFVINFIISLFYLPLIEYLMTTKLNISVDYYPYFKLVL
jgi:hypothetical protein